MVSPTCIDLADGHLLVVPVKVNIEVVKVIREGGVVGWGVVFVGGFVVRNGLMYRTEEESSSGFLRLYRL